MPKNKETLCFFVFLCFHKQTKQTLEVLSFMKLEQIIFVKEAVSFILRKQDILVKEVLSFIMKKQDNFLKEVVSFMKTLAKCTAYFNIDLRVEFAKCTA